MTSAAIPVISAARSAQLLQQIDVLQVMRSAFVALARGDCVQPEQKLVLLPGGQGDFINYFAADNARGVLGCKISPYLTAGEEPIVTAWTLLLSIKTGQPLMLCDASQLTVARTAATTLLAVDLLAPADAAILTLAGSGAIGRAHLKLALTVRNWQQIRVVSRDGSLNVRALADELQCDPARLVVYRSAQEAASGSDVVLLCTSAAAPVIDPGRLSKPCLIASISTNAPGAHEVPPASLPLMDVYCDYRLTTPTLASEMVQATAAGWQVTDIKGDLPLLVSGACARPDYRRPVYFRSLGLGLEDIALAHALIALQDEDN